MEMEIIDLFPWLGLWFKATDVYSKLGEAAEDKAALFLGCVAVSAARAPEGAGPDDPSVLI